MPTQQKSSLSNPRRVPHKAISHGWAKGGGTPTYTSYTSAKGRCNNLNDPAYARYGGRGIKFLFTSVEQLVAEIGPRPDGKTLDRISNDGNYEVGNVRWATRIEQSRPGCRATGKRRPRPPVSDETRCRMSEAQLRRYRDRAT